VLYREIIILRLNFPEDFSHNNLLLSSISGHRSWNLDLPDDQILNTEDLSHHLLCVPLRDGSDGDFLFDSGWVKERDQDCAVKIKIRLSLRRSQRD